LNGDFETILEKLEEKGKKSAIFKYKEMSELRSTLTKNTKDKLNTNGMY